MDDLISRAEAIRIASGYCHPANIADELRKLPSAQPKKGKWIIEKWYRTYRFRCTECGCHHRALYDFCPSCGADMREVKE